jgi:hypothetical protein
MPDHSTRSSSTAQGPTTAESTSSQAVGDLTEQNQLGNAAIQQEMLEQSSNSSLSSFESTWKEITSEGAITEYAVDAVDGALADVRAWIRAQAEPDQAAAAAQFVRTLQGQIDASTRKVMTDYGISQWISQQPELIVSGALTAAAAYVITNQKIPELEGSVELAEGHSLSGGVDLGTTLDIAVKSLQLGYSYTSETVNARANYNQDLQDGSWNVSGRLEADLVQMGMVNFADELRAYVRGSYESDGSWDTAAGVEGRNGNWSYGVEGYANDGGLVDADSGVRATLKFNF